MSASPVPTPVTTPALVTLATDVLEVRHVAWLVMTCAVPFERFAVAPNDVVEPTAGAAPLTVTVDTDSVGADGGVGDGGVVGVLSLLLQAIVASSNTDA